MTEHRTCLLLLFFHQTWATPVTWGRLNLVKVFKLCTRNSSSYLKADFEKNTLPGLVIHQNNVFVLLRIVQDYFYILLMFCYIQCFFQGLPEVKGFDLAALTQDDLQSLKPWWTMMTNSWILKCTCMIKVWSKENKQRRDFKFCVHTLWGLTRLDQQHQQTCGVKHKTVLFLSRRSEDWDITPKIAVHGNNVERMFHLL